MRGEITHSLFLISAVFLGFIFPASYLSEYYLQISALLFIILYIKKRLSVSKDSMVESVIFTLVILIIVNSSGGATSPYFFLTHFLLFSISLLLSAVIAVTMTVTLIIFFLFSMPQGNLNALIQIVSLAFLTPFALFMGSEYEKNLKLKRSLSRSKEDTLLFLSLLLKNQIKIIRGAVENFVGDEQLTAIRKSVKKMEHYIDKFEKEI